MVHNRIPVTTPARTLVDLAAEVPEAVLARAVHEASVRWETTPDDVEAILARHPTAAGARKLRAILHGDTRITLSKLEDRFLEVLKKANLPLPQTNCPAGGRYVDCRWPDKKVTVELDSYRYHNSRHTWELDRQRERAAYRRGDQFRRYTWHDVTKERKPMLRELRSLLD
jgi:very-short-patch-repair endonuclease